MTLTISYIKQVLLTRRILLLCGFILFMSSCDFVGKELRQDQRLAYYRHQASIIPDSIADRNKLINAYTLLIDEASKDKYLITPRKKNKLLSEIYCIIGSQYHEQNEISKSIDAYSKAISFNKTNPYAHYNRGYIYQRTGNDSLAILDYTDVILYDESFVDAYYNRGLVYQKQTDFQLAVEDYSKAIELNPPYIADVYNNRGNVYQVMFFYDKAIEDYSNAVTKDSTMHIVYYNRADAYLHIGEYDNAFDDYKKANLTDSVKQAVIKRVNNIRDEMKLRQ